MSETMIQRVKPKKNQNNQYLKNLKYLKRLPNQKADLISTAEIIHNLPNQIHNLRPNVERLMAHSNCKKCNKTPKGNQSLYRNRMIKK